MACGNLSVNSFCCVSKRFPTWWQIPWRVSYRISKRGVALIPVSQGILILVSIGSNNLPFGSRSTWRPVGALMWCLSTTWRAGKHTSCFPMLSCTDSRYSSCPGDDSELSLNWHILPFPYAMMNNSRSLMRFARAIASRTPSRNDVRSLNCNMANIVVGGRGVPTTVFGWIIIYA